jgi:hypothetical protein
LEVAAGKEERGRGEEFSWREISSLVLLPLICLLCVSIILVTYSMYNNY